MKTEWGKHVRYHFRVSRKNRISPGSTSLWFVGIPSSQSASEKETCPLISKHHQFGQTPSVLKRLLSLFPEQIKRKSLWFLGHGGREAERRMQSRARKQKGGKGDTLGGGWILIHHDMEVVFYKSEVPIFLYPRLFHNTTGEEDKPLRLHLGSSRTKQNLLSQMNPFLTAGGMC